MTHADATPERARALVRAQLGAVSPLRRPGALALMYSYRLAAGLLVAAPISAVLSGSGIFAFPQGDASVFAPGGDALVDLMVTSGAYLSSALRESAYLFVMLAGVGLLPYALWLSALGRGGQLSLSESWALAIRHLPRLALLSALGLLLGALLALVAALGYSALEAPLAARFDERRATLWQAASLLPWLPVFCLLSILTDLARAAVIQHDAGLRAALGVALRAFRARKLLLFSSWLSPHLWSVALVAGVAMLIEQLAVEQPGDLRVAGAWLIHQLAVVVLLVLRGTWHRRALISAGSTEPRARAVRADPSRGKVAGSGALADPS